MFRFRKTREPEQASKDISTFEESANYLDAIAQTADKEKSHLNRIVRDEPQGEDQIGQTAATFEQTAQGVSGFKVILKNLKKEIRSIQSELKDLGALRSESAELFGQFCKLRSQLKMTEAQQKSIQRPTEEFNVFLEKVDKTKAEITIKLNSIEVKQVELLNKYDDFLKRLEKAEEHLNHLSSMKAEFEKTAENVATESARITIWMEATEKMSEKLKQATQLFEDSKQRIDRVNELVEYIESKTNVFAKQKELLKNAHIEAGKANAIFWEIKSKHSELERDVEKIKKMETHVLKFNSKLRSIENRISRLDINIRKLIPLSEKIDKTDKEVNALTDKLDHLDQRMRDSRKYAESIAGECNDIRKSQENIRLDVSEIIDQFGKLSDLRIFTEEKTRALRKYFEWAEEKLSELGDVSKKTSPKIQAGMRNR